MANVVKYKKTGDINLQGGMLLDALAASNVPNAESGKKTLFLDVADTTLKTKDSSGNVATIGGGASELPVTALGTSGTQTIDRSVSDKFTLTPASAVTLETSNFTDMQESEILIKDGATLVTFPTTWDWQTSDFLPPTLQYTGYDRLKISANSYGATTRFSAVRNAWWQDPEQAIHLLAHFNGDNNSTTFVDSSGRGKVLAAVGSGKISTTDPKFGTGSLLCAYGSYATVNDSVDFDPGSGDFTFHCWVKPTSISGRQGIWFPDADCAFGIEIWEGKICLWASAGSGWNIITSDSSQGQGVTTLSTNAWTHVAVCRSGNNWYIFVNGNVDKTISAAGTISEYRGLRRIGSAPVRGEFVGYIDEVVWIKGIAKWTTNFTPPSSER